MKTMATVASVKSAITAMTIFRRAGVSQFSASAAAAWPRIDFISRRCEGPGRPRIALATSLRPRRSAIRMVAELAPLVDFSSLVRSRSGTSSTERYTRSEPPAEISTVDVLNRPDASADSPQYGQRASRSAKVFLQRLQVITLLPVEPWPARRAFRPRPVGLLHYQAQPE